VQVLDNKLHCSSEAGANMFAMPRERTGVITGTSYMNSILRYVPRAFSPNHSVLFPLPHLLERRKSCRDHGQHARQVHIVFVDTSYTERATDSDCVTTFLLSCHPAILPSLLSLRLLIFGPSGILLLDFVLFGSSSHTNHALQPPQHNHFFAPRRCPHPTTLC
jgi:hypothetical protein